MIPELQPPDNSNPWDNVDLNVLSWDRFGLVFSNAHWSWSKQDGVSAGHDLVNGKLYWDRGGQETNCYQVDNSDQEESVYDADRDRICCPGPRWLLRRILRLPNGKSLKERWPERNEVGLAVLLPVTRGIALIYCLIEIAFQRKESLTWDSWMARINLDQVPLYIPGIKRILRESSQCFDLPQIG